MIDTHAHLYLEQFRDDIDEVVIRARQEGLQHILLPNVDSSSTQSLLELAGQYPDFMTPMMGLHPCSVKEDYQKELDHIKEILERQSFCAIGEVGLDLYWDKTFQLEQEEVFRIQLEWALEMDKPVVIHARESFQEIFSILKDYKGTNLKGVFHSFTGGKKEVQQIKDLGDFYFGINGIVTFKNSSLKDVLSDIGIGSLLLETDSPYLAPTPFRGKRNESSYLSLICNKIADNLNMVSTDVTNITNENAKRLFKLSSFIKTV